MIREATADEIAKYCPPTVGYETWGLVVDEGEITGHLFVSIQNGQAFGHNTKVWSDDATAAAKLWFTAEAKLVSLGYNKVTIHFDKDTDPRVKSAWIRRGATPIMEIYEVQLKCQHQ